MQGAMTDDGNKKTNNRAKEIFSSKNMARMAVFTALAYLLYMPIFEFSIIPTVSFLKIDFSNSFVMMAGFALGPIAGMIVGVLKEIMHALTFSSTVGVGELANILIMIPYVVIPSAIYKKHRNIKTVLITLAVGCFLQAVWSIPVNYLLSFPFFVAAFGGSWSGGMALYLEVWYWAVLFNFVKTLLISAVVLLLYKQFQRLFNFIFNKERRRNVIKSAGCNNTDCNNEAVHTDENSDGNGGSSEQHVYDVQSPEEMQALGSRIAEGFSGGEVVLLTGELGAGKTVFCKGLAKGLKIAGEIVSPTFTIMNEHVGKFKFNHFDAYRLSGADEAEAAGLSEFIGGKDCVCAVEWWENIDGMFDDCDVIKVVIEKTGDSSRRVTVTK